MEITELNNADIRETRKAPMRKIGESESFEITSLKGYVQCFVQTLKPSASLSDIKQQKIEICGGNFYAHIFLSYGESDKSLIVVYNLDAEKIEGHYILKLNQVT